MAPGGQSSESNIPTVTALSRWSITDKQLPAVDKIKALHVFDFDNTLFRTALPNPKLWTNATIGSLSNPDFFFHGGWWQNNRILSATGEGVDIEEPRAWKGHWNETIVELVQLSIKQEDALCVLLTGRAEARYSDLLKRMVATRGLDFDMMGLKPAAGPNGEQFSSTMKYKQAFLKTLMETYKDAEEIRIYEDRPKHTKEFRDFLGDFNKRMRGANAPRKPLTAEVIQVADQGTNLDPVSEVAEIQQIINEHNVAIAEDPANRKSKSKRLMIKQTVFYTGYLIAPADTNRLFDLADVPRDKPDGQLKYQGNNIMIHFRDCPAYILEKVGGMGSKMTWEATDTACEGGIWAVRLRPSSPSAQIHTENSPPVVALATRRGARPADAHRIQDWRPIPADQLPFTFETTVGQKVLLRVAPEDADEDEAGGGGDGFFANNKGRKRKHPDDEDEYAQTIYHSAATNENQQNRDKGKGNGKRGGEEPRNGKAARNGGFAGRGGGNHQRGGGGGGGGGFRGGRGGPAQMSRGGGGSGGGRNNGRNRGGGDAGHHYVSLDDVGTRENGGGEYGASNAMYDDAPPQQRQRGQQLPKGPGGGGGRKANGQR